MGKIPLGVLGKATRLQSFPRAEEAGEFRFSERDSRREGGCEGTLGALGYTCALPISGRRPVVRRVRLGYYLIRSSAVLEPECRRPSD